MKVFFKPALTKVKENMKVLATSRDESDMKVWRKQASLRPSSCSSQQEISGKDHHQNLCDRVDYDDGSRTSCIYEQGDATFESLIVCSPPVEISGRDYQQLVARHAPQGRYFYPHQAGTFSCDTIKMGEAIG